MLIQGTSSQNGGIASARADAHSDLRLLPGVLALPGSFSALVVLRPDGWREALS
jgi:hypothetical protein